MFREYFQGGCGANLQLGCKFAPKKPSPKPNAPPNKQIQLVLFKRKRRHLVKGSVCEVRRSLKANAGQPPSILLCF